MVDHDTSSGVRDARCGQLTYDGHNGTDILLRNFKAMDSAVGVYAVADGKVLRIKDGAFDRQKDQSVSGPGNYVLLQHGAYTVKYCHLKKGSILVREGEAIKRGQQLAQVGSSGHSAYPHLHLGVLDQQNKVIDPIGGPCSPERNLITWDKQPCYDTGKYGIESGFIRFVPNVDTLKEGLPNVRKFSTASDTTVCFWALMHGLRKGDKLEFKWYTPRNALYTTVSDDWKGDWSHDYTWSHLKMPLQSGVWHIELYVNKQLFFRNQCTVMVD
jgi:hypothetical protein